MYVACYPFFLFVRQGGVTKVLVQIVRVIFCCPEPTTSLVDKIARLYSGVKREDKCIVTYGEVYQEYLGSSGVPFV